jgi:hypothetical protein
VLGDVELAQRIQGRWIRTEDLLWLREWMATHSDWSRKRLARELCAAWNWRDGAGRVKDFAARSFLLKLEGLGQIRLPPLRPRSLTGFRRPVHEPAGWQEPPVLAAALSALRPLRVEVVQTGTAIEHGWSFYLSRYHYLGLRVVGENLGYLVRDAQGRDVACLLFGAAAWRCAPRDRHLGWDDAQRAVGLAQTANNTRFLILPWLRVPQLASHVLGLVMRRVDADWREKYGHGLRWLETFVERERFRGTCYQAANWRCVGQTTGRSRQDRQKRLRVPIKDIYIYALAGGRR